MSVLVSAVMPISDPARLNLARTAVNNFLKQHYRTVELIVVNATGKPVLTQEENLKNLKGIRLEEVQVDAKKNAASLKNVGIKKAKGSLILPLDDDDWFHPFRLVYQMANREGLSPSLLKFQLLLDVSKVLKKTGPGETGGKLLMHLHSSTTGVSSTLIFPKSKATGELWLYNEQLNTGENDELLSRMKVTGLNVTVCDNSHFTEKDSVSWPLLSVAVFHTSNELSRSRFFHGKEPQNNKPPMLTKGDMELLKQVLLSYNFSVV